MYYSITSIQARLLPLSNSIAATRYAFRKNVIKTTVSFSSSRTTATTNLSSSSTIQHWMEDSNKSEGNKIGVISLSNQATRNALSFNTLKNLYDQIQHFYYKEPSVKVIVLQSSVKGIFSSGHDLKELRRIQQQEEDDDIKKKDQYEELFRICSESMECIVKGPKPIIAKVDGVATAAGCQLVASCDLAYASSRSKFATPGVSIGLFCSTPGVALGRCVSSKKHAMEMLLTGQMINAQHAQDIGLINRVVDDDEQNLNEYVHNIASIIASKSQSAINTGKPLFVKQMELCDLSSAYQIASDGMVQGLLTQDCKEGIDAFLSKRQPNWTQ